MTAIGDENRSYLLVGIEVGPCAHVQSMDPTDSDGTNVRTFAIATCLEVPLTWPCWHGPPRPTTSSAGTDRTVTLAQTWPTAYRAYVDVQG
jgi:hypothetical protein